MWFTLRAVEIDFLASAPRRWVVETQLRSPRQAVWDAFVDPSGWRHWCAIPKLERGSERVCPAIRW